MRFKKILLIAVVLVLAAIFALVKLLPDKDKFEYVTEEARVTDLVQTVTETGTVKSAEELKLGFLNSGKISRISVSVGDKIEAGQVLAELDTGALLIRENEAEANLEVAEKNLQKLISGATKEEIAIDRTAAAQAEAAYFASQKEYEKIEAVLMEAIKQAERSVFDLESPLETDRTPVEQAILTATANLASTKALYQKAIDDLALSSPALIGDKMKIARTALDKFNTIVGDEDAKNLLSVKNPKYLEQAKTAFDQGVLSVPAALGLGEELSNASSREKVLSALEKGVAALKEVSSALGNLFQALENSVTSSLYTPAELEADKTTVSAQSSSVAASITLMEAQILNLKSAILNFDTRVSAAENSLKEARAAYDSALLAAKNAWQNAQLNRDQQLTASQSRVDANFEAWQVAKARLARTAAAANSYDISLGQSRIKQAEASLESIRRQIEDSQIKSVTSGTVTDVKYKIGEQVAQGSPLIFVLGDAGFNIEMLVSEADVSKLKIGNQAKITLDAYGDDLHFSGQLSSIDPAETVIQDVVYYKAKIAFDAEEIEIKSGMTANVTIVAAEKKQAISLPSRAVIDRNGSGKFVRLLRAGEASEVPVELGLRGDGGLVEVLSGIKAGDMIIVSSKEK